MKTKSTRNIVFIVTNTARPIGYIRCGHIVYSKMLICWGLFVVLIILSPNRNP